MNKLFPCQTYTTNKYQKVYFCDNKSNIKKIVIMCKAKDLLDAIN